MFCQVNLIGKLRNKSPGTFIKQANNQANLSGGSLQLFYCTDKCGTGLGNSTEAGQGLSFPWTWHQSWGKRAAHPSQPGGQSWVCSAAGGENRREKEKKNQQRKSPNSHPQSPQTWKHQWWALGMLSSLAIPSHTHSWGLEDLGGLLQPFWFYGIVAPGGLSATTCPEGTPGQGWSLDMSVPMRLFTPTLPGSGDPLPAPGTGEEHLDTSWSQTPIYQQGSARDSLGSWYPRKPH